MKLPNIFLFILLILPAVLYSQPKGEWFPDGLNVQPYTAAQPEARTGFGYLLGESSIRLDIGTSADLYHYRDACVVFSFGVDLFTYTRLHGSSEFHFPVETIDYLFGVNAGWKILSGNCQYGARLRISHISAHLVDGSYDYSIGDWRNYNRPRVYSREFIELMPFYRINGFRTYFGFTFLIHATPDRFGRGIFQTGFDHYFVNLTDVFTPFAAFDFKLSKHNSYSGTSSIAAGVKFGRWDRKGFSLVYYFISGKSIHGEYFDLNETYSMIGFNLDL